MNYERWSKEELIAEIRRLKHETGSPENSRLHPASPAPYYIRILDQLNEGVGMTDENQNICYVSQTLLNILGYSIEEVMGMKLTDFVHTRSLNEVERQLEMRRKGEYGRYEVSLKCADGSIRDMIVSASSFMDKESGFRGSMGIFMDITERKETERRLAETLSVMQAVISTIPGHLKVVDTQFNTIDFDFEASPHNKCYKDLHGKDEPCKNCTVKDVFETGKPSTRYSTLEEEQRDECSYKFFASPIRNSSGEMTGAVELAMDVTDLRMMEKALEEANRRLEQKYSLKSEELDRSREYLEEAQKTAHIGNWEWHLAGDNMYWSDEMFRILGITPGSVKPSIARMLDFVPEKDQDTAALVFERTMKPGNVSDKRFRIIRDDGTERIVISRSRAVAGKNGYTTKLLGTIQDITELQLAEEKFSETDTMLKSVFNVTSTGICITDENGIFILVNRAFASLFGYSIEELTGKHYSLITPEYKKEEYRKLYSRVIESDDASFEFEGVKKDGGNVPILVSAGVTETASGKKINITAVSDISRIKLLEEEKERKESLLIERSRMAAMGEMIGVIAHQWKQPLNAVAIIAQTIGDDYESGYIDSSVMDEHIDMIMEQVKFMDQTIDDFRSFFAPTKVLKEFKVCKAVREVVSMMTPQLKANNISVELSDKCRSDVSPDIKGYPNEFKQVVLNLVTNSKDAINDLRNSSKEFETIEGVVTIDVGSENGHIVVTISDNGGGIPEESLKNLFSPYYTTKGEQGTGIGLYMANTIITKKMNGEIEAYNNGKGAVFKIILPPVS
ncbi:PAS domain S-box protein [Limisalsivibrio acetivorans]|uniref:PAS domain S-box protein n=1 Tax=Limisalsivibrio acetivorans TaxID=1304888 RepID=UPI0003B62255|nr:PAS domain S-box protein [Limisalsivibrio acetivorans]